MARSGQHRAFDSEHRTEGITSVFRTGGPVRADRIIHGRATGRTPGSGISEKTPHLRVVRPRTGSCFNGHSVTPVHREQNSAVPDARLSGGFAGQNRILADNARGRQGSRARGEDPVRRPPSDSRKSVSVVAFCPAFWHTEWRGGMQARRLPCLMLRGEPALPCACRRPCQRV